MTDDYESSQIEIYTLKVCYVSNIYIQSVHFSAIKAHDEVEILLS